MARIVWCTGGGLYRHQQESMLYVNKAANLDSKSR